MQTIALASSDARKWKNKRLRTRLFEIHATLIRRSRHRAPPPRPQRPRSAHRPDRCQLAPYHRRTDPTRRLHRPYDQPYLLLGSGTQATRNGHRDDLPHPNARNSSPTPATPPPTPAHPIDEIPKMEAQPVMTYGLPPSVVESARSRSYHHADRSAGDTFPPSRPLCTSRRVCNAHRQAGPSCDRSRERVPSSEHPSLLGDTPRPHRARKEARDRTGHSSLLQASSPSMPFTLDDADI